MYTNVFRMIIASALTNLRKNAQVQSFVMLHFCMCHYKKAVCQKSCCCRSSDFEMTVCADKNFLCTTDVPNVSYDAKISFMTFVASFSTYLNSKSTFKILDFSLYVHAIFREIHHSRSKLAKTCQTTAKRWQNVFIPIIASTFTNLSENARGQSFVMYVSIKKKLFFWKSSSCQLWLWNDSMWWEKIFCKQIMVQNIS